MSGYEYDVVILVADSHTETFVEVLLKEKGRALGIGRIRYEMIVHEESDPGVFKNPHELLREYYQGRAKKVMVVLDEEWEGSPGKERIRNGVKDLIVRNTNWKEEDIEVIVPSPEIEIWAWYDNQRLARALGVDESTVRKCREEGEPRKDGKPKRPKEALECIARSARMPYGRGVIRLVAGGVSRRVVAACRDEEFGRFVSFLRAVQKGSDVDGT